ncbi:MAG: putative amidohydrolase YtcJ [Alcanivorax sp.]|jgi:predicted amidohydrolase YtcJ
MKSGLISAAALALLAVLPVFAQDNTANPAADLIIHNGKIYTLEAELPWVSAVAVRDGKYTYLGGEAGLVSFRGPETREIDLAGKMAMPGINDMHSHPWQGGLKALYECNFAFLSTPDEIASTLRGCIAVNPDAQWIRGGQWTSDFFTTHSMESPKRWLDEISTEKAIYLEDDSGHHAWFNSKAQELAVIEDDVTDPDGGEFRRDVNGDINGIALERATNAFLDAIPESTHAQNMAAISKALQLANSFGITGIAEARTPVPALAAYVALAQAGKLTAHTITYQQTPIGQRNKPMDVAPLVALAEGASASNLHSRFAKFFLDGVPTASRSAVMVEPYLTNEDYPESTTGTLMIEPSILTADLSALDAAGFTVKIHTAGDGAVRIALDAIEKVRASNGASGLRFELGHAGYIHPDDLPRFVELNVTADLSPYLWYPRPIIDSIVGAVGERAYRYFPLKDLIASGANMAMGSDWPSAAEDMNPWPAIEAMVSRKNPYSENAESLWPEQAISLEQALAIATQGGAMTYRLEHATGSVALGKSADLIVLNHNVFEIPTSAISDTAPEYTLFAGDIVYQRQH